MFNKHESFKSSQFKSKKEFYSLKCGFESQINVSKLENSCILKTKFLPAAMTDTTGVDIEITSRYSLYVCSQVH